MLLEVNYGIAELNVILLNSAPKRRSSSRELGDAYQWGSVND
jgi:hypothetical protein